jgi:hypothetical protein
VIGLSLRALRGSACECYRMDTAQNLRGLCNRATPGGSLFARLWIAFDRRRHVKPSSRHLSRMTSPIHLRAMMPHTGSANSQRFWPPCRFVEWTDLTQRAHLDTAPVLKQERGGDVLVALRKSLGGQRGRCRPVGCEGSVEMRPDSVAPPKGVVQRSLCCYGEESLNPS